MPLFQRFFKSRSNDSPRLKYHPCMPKWRLETETFTELDVNWICELILKSLPLGERQEYLISKYRTADLTAAHAYVRKSLESRGEEGKDQAMASYQAQKRLLQELQTQFSDKVFKKPGALTFKWAHWYSKKIQGNHLKQAPVIQLVFRQIASQWKNPLELEKPAEAKKLIQNVARVLWSSTIFKRFEEDSSDPSVWLAGTYAFLFWGVLQVWRCVMFKITSKLDPADTGASLAAILETHFPVPFEAPGADVPDLGHRHKRPQEGSDPARPPDRDASTGVFDPTCVGVLDPNSMGVLGVTCTGGLDPTSQFFYTPLPG